MYRFRTGTAYGTVPVPVQKIDLKLEAVQISTASEAVPVQENFLETVQSGTISVHFLDKRYRYGSGYKSCTACTVSDIFVMNFGSKF